MTHSLSSPELNALTLEMATTAATADAAGDAATAGAWYAAIALIELRRTESFSRRVQQRESERRHGTTSLLSFSSASR